MVSEPSGGNPRRDKRSLKGGILGTMTDQPRVIDGADRRKQRLLELLHYIHTSKGATSEQCLAMMTINFGMRRKTSAEYLQDLHLANLIVLGRDSGKWFTTGNYKKLAEKIYGSV